MAPASPTSRRTRRGDTPGTTTGYWKAWSSPGSARSGTVRPRRSSPSSDRRPGDGEALLAHEGVAQRRLARAVGTHDGVDLAERDLEVDPGAVSAVADAGGAVARRTGRRSYLDLHRLTTSRGEETPPRHLTCVGRNRPGGGEGVGGPGGQVERRPVAGALDLGVEDLALGQRSLGVAAPVADGERPRCRRGTWRCAALRSRPALPCPRAGRRAGPTSTHPRSYPPLLLGGDELAVDPLPHRVGELGVGKPGDDLLEEPADQQPGRPV